MAEELARTGCFFFPRLVFRPTFLRRLPLFFAAVFLGRLASGFVSSITISLNTLQPTVHKIKKKILSRNR